MSAALTSQSKQYATKARDLHRQVRAPDWADAAGGYASCLHASCCLWIHAALIAF